MNVQRHEWEVLQVEPRLGDLFDQIGLVRNRGGSHNEPDYVKRSFVGFGFRIDP